MAAGVKDAVYIWLFLPERKDSSVVSASGSVQGQIQGSARGHTKIWGRVT